MSLEALHREIAACRDCEERFGFAPRPILQGGAHARILQIGQAPSRTVHQTGRPFDDASGRTLREVWYQVDDATFYNPDCFYITSIAHCYPGRAPRGGDRPPPLHCARKWLWREVEAVDSRIIVLLGGRAAGFFFPEARLEALVFADQRLAGRPAFVLPHPSPRSGWLRDHPDFLSLRMPQIRRAIHAALRQA